MTDNVVEFSGITKLDIPAETILRRAAEQGLTDVLVIGWEEDGQIYAASSTGNVGKNLHLIEAFRHELMSGGHEG